MGGSETGEEKDVLNDPQPDQADSQQARPEKPAASSKPQSEKESPPVHLLLFHSRHRQLFPVLGGRPMRKSLGTSGQSRWDRLKASVYSTYESLREKFDYQERICGLLRHSPRIKVIHPQRMSRDQAERQIKDFFKARRKKHRNWLAVDCILAGLGSLLVWVPGPNIFFFYPAARALSHYLAQKGATHVFERSVLFFQGDSLIDEIEANQNNLQTVQPKVQKLQERYQVENLSGLLGKL